jgi:hypothetical protein
MISKTSRGRGQVFRKLRFWRPRPGTASLVRGEMAGQRRPTVARQGHKGSGQGTTDSLAKGTSTAQNFVHARKERAWRGSQPAAGRCCTNVRDLPRDVRA